MIRQLRKAVGLNQSGLAEKVGMTQQQLSAYESGKLKIENMTLITAARLARVLKCHAEDLINSKEEKTMLHRIIKRNFQISGKVSESEFGEVSFDNACSGETFVIKDGFANYDDAKTALSEYVSTARRKGDTIVGEIYSVQDYENDEDGNEISVGDEQPAEWNMNDIFSL